MPAWYATLFVLGLLAVVGGLTLLRIHGIVSVHALASSPDQLAEGHVWLLATSGIVLEGPLVAGMLGFAALAVTALLVCPPRVLFLSALLGHVCSTVLAYLGLGLVRVFEPEAFRFFVTAPDYGVSAIAAAWLGAVAAITWTRRRGRAGRLFTVIFVVAVTAFGWSLRRDLNALDSEHVIAFAIGIGLAVGMPRLFLRRAGAPVAA